MSVACDPASLISNAACLEYGIPPGFQKPVIISLLCQIAGVAINPTTLISNAACLECGIPAGMYDAVINYLLCQIANGSGLTTNTASYPLTDGTPLNISFAHGLGHTPIVLRAVLLCKANDSNSGITVGQEIDIRNMFDSNNDQIPFGYGADATNIYLSGEGLTGGTTALNWLGLGNKTISSLNNFLMKVYYQ